MALQSLEILRTFVWWQHKTCATRISLHLKISTILWSYNFTRYYNITLKRGKLANSRAFCPAVSSASLSFVRANQGTVRLSFYNDSGSSAFAYR